MPSGGAGGAHLDQRLRKDLMRLVPLVMLVAVMIFFVNFKSWRGVVLPFLTLSMATVWILGLMGHLGVKITTVGISIPILMIAVGSSYAIHILNQYYADYNLSEREIGRPAACHEPYLSDRAAYRPDHVCGVFNPGHP
ncbi:MAG: hypothetical protein R2860_02095 [Desulfobacterales bacterium]